LLSSTELGAKSTEQEEIFHAQGSRLSAQRYFGVARSRKDRTRRGKCLDLKS